LPNAENDSRLPKPPFCSIQPSKTRDFQVFGYFYSLLFEGKCCCKHVIIDVLRMSLDLSTMQTLKKKKTRRRNRNSTMKMKKKLNKSIHQS